MNIDALSKNAAISMTNSVLREVEATIKTLQPDVSATAPEHVRGYDAGFRAAKRAMIDALAADRT